MAKKWLALRPAASAMIECLKEEIGHLDNRMLQLEELKQNTPAVVIDGRLIFKRTFPTGEELRKRIKV